LCVGFLAEEVALLSPKFQQYEEGDPVLLSVNFTENGAFPFTHDAENAATGSTFFTQVFTPIN
jgi:hypothetical protein